VARLLNTDADIDNFVADAIAAANHHGPTVKAVIQPLADALRNRLSLKADKVSVFERNGILGRTCWIVLNGRRYCFSYGYKNKVIELRENSTRGATLHSFDNSTTPQVIATAVASM
jgi:hypothetical protein